MYEKDILDFLAGKQTISIPEIQDEYGCSYKEAKKTMSFLFNGFFALDEPCGIDYPLNYKYISQNDLSNTQIEILSAALSNDELELLCKLYKRASVNDGVCFPSRHYKELMQKGIVHRFDSRWFLSVNDKAVEALLNVRIELPDDCELACIAFPIVVSCARTGEKPHELLKLTFISQKCKDYIKETLEKASNTQKLCFADTQPGKTRNTTLHFDIIESFIGANVFESIDEYVMAAKENLAVIQNSAHCSKVFKAAAKKAVDELGEFTLENIKEIQKLLHKGDGEGKK